MNLESSRYGRLALVTLMVLLALGYGRAVESPGSTRVDASAWEGLPEALRHFLDAHPATRSAAAEPEVVNQPGDPAWVWQDNPSNSQMIDLELESMDQGWAIGIRDDNGSEVLQLQDGQWSIVRSFDQRVLWALEVASDEERWLAGFDLVPGGIRPVLTRMSGTTFTDIAVPECTTLIGMQMFGPDEGWAGGNDGNSMSCILHYLDGTWQRDDSPGEALIVALDLDPMSGEGWALGSNGEILERRQGIWYRSVSPADGPDGGIYYDLTRDATGGAWAVGTDGRSTLHWNGTAWTFEDLGYPRSFLGLDALDTGDVYAVGTGARLNTTPTPEPLLLHYDGNRWRTQPLPGRAGSLGAVDMLDVRQGWAVGNRTTLRYGPITTTPTVRPSTTPSPTLPASATAEPSPSSTPQGSLLIPHVHRDG